MLGHVISDIVREQPDLELIAAGENVAATVGATRAQFVLLHAAREEECAELLDRFPRLKVLSVEDDGRQGFIYELRPCRRALGELSPARLISALRVSGGLA